MEELYKSYIAPAEESAHISCIMSLLENGADPYLMCLVGYTFSKPTPGRAWGTRYRQEVDLLDVLEKLFKPKERENMEKMVLLRRKSTRTLTRLRRLAGI